MLALQSLLEGKAKQFWMTLRADKRSSYTGAKDALKQRFPTHTDDSREWASKARAICEMNTLSQGPLSSEKYVDKANDLFATLGEEYSMVLATKFVDGIGDNIVKYLIDVQAEDVYRFPEVIKAFEKCMKSQQRRELAAQRLEESREVFNSNTEIIIRVINSQPSSCTWFLAQATN